MAMALRFFFSFLVLLVSFALLAQKPAFGVFAGGQATTAHYTVGGKKQPTDYKFGAQAGVLLKIPFENRLYFSPALYYSLKGYTVTLNHPAYPPGSTAKNNDTRFHTVDGALLLQYDFSAQPSHFFVRLGPALEFVLSGTEKFDQTNGPRIERKMKFSFGDYGFVTASLVGHLGYETENGFFTFGHYALGLGSANNADYGPIIKHRIAGISVGKYFSRK